MSKFRTGMISGICSEILQHFALASASQVSGEYAVLNFPYKLVCGRCGQFD